jgi:hypothetical protein
VPATLPRSASERGLTPPSRGRPASGPPLTSNVRQFRKVPSLLGGVLLQSKSLLRQASMLRRHATQEQPSVRQAHRTCSKPFATQTLDCFAVRRQNAGSLRSSTASLQPASEMQQTSRCLRSAQSHLYRHASASVALRSGHLVAQRHSPNPSVKGTSRKRAAPYVER